MKNKKKKYQVKFAIRAIVEIEVDAESGESAVEIAKEKMKKIKTFNPELSYLDGVEEVCGWDDLEAWNKTI